MGIAGSKVGMSNLQHCLRACAVLATLILPRNVFQTVLKCLFWLRKELVQSAVANKPEVSNIRPARRFHPARGPNEFHEVIFCGPYKDFVPQCECLASISVCEKLRFFKSSENWHEVMDDICYKSWLALQGITLFFFFFRDYHHFGLPRMTSGDRCCVP